MVHYVVILVPSGDGWRALVPDVPEAEAYGSDLDAAKFAVSNSLTQRICANGATPPRPRELTQIATDREWMSRNDIDFAKAIVAVIPLATEMPAATPFGPPLN